MQEEDEGDYECKTATGLYYRFRLFVHQVEPEKEEEVTTTTPIQDETTTEYQEPKIDIQDVSGDEGSIAELVCGESSKYDGYIEWKRLDEGYMTEFSDIVKNKLILTNLRKEDAGYYECIMKDSAIHLFKLVLTEKN